MFLYPSLRKVLRASHPANHREDCFLLLVSIIANVNANVNTNVDTNINTNVIVIIAVE